MTRTSWPCPDWRSGATNWNREGPVSRVFNLIPGYEPLNRGFATMVNGQRYNPVLTALDNNPKWGTKLAQGLSDYSAVATGRGILGPTPAIAQHWDGVGGTGGQALEEGCREAALFAAAFSTMAPQARPSRA